LVRKLSEPVRESPRELARKIKNALDSSN